MVAHIRVTLIHILLLRLIGNDRRVGHEAYICQNHGDHRVDLGVDVLDIIRMSLGGDIEQVHAVDLHALDPRPKWN